MKPRSETKIKPIPRAAVRRAATPADTRPELFNFFTEMFDKAVQARAGIIVEETIHQMQARGWKPPTPSRAYIAETHVREALGRRAGSPMAPQTFEIEYLKPGILRRVPATVTGNRKTKYIYWEELESKVLSEKKADSIRRHIIES